MIDSDWLRQFLQYLLLLPSMILCTLPLKDSFRYPLRRVYGLAALGCVLFSLAGATIASAGLEADGSKMVLAAAALGFGICACITDVSRWKLVSVFVNAIALLSFTGMAGTLVDSLLLPSGAITDSTDYGVLAQWIAVLALLGVTWPLLRRPYTWLVKEYHEDKVWRIAWLMPATIAACNMMMTPRKYATMHVGRIYSITIMLEIVLLLILMLYGVMFYYMARRNVERAALERRASLLEIQGVQYAKLKAHMEQTARQRHDFRHSIRLIDELVRQGELAELRRYVSEYIQQLDEATMETYCSNPALNALLCYYAAIARKDGTSVQLQIALPEKLPIPEVELCGLMGNLMENAIDACARLPKEERYLAISAELQGERVYIVSTNAFDGNVSYQDGRYRSTKRDGEGMGLRSIRAVAERYHGGLNARAQGRSFCVDVYMKAAPDM